MCFAVLGDLYQQQATPAFPIGLVPKAPDTLEDFSPFVRETSYVKIVFYFTHFQL